MKNAIKELSLAKGITHKKGEHRLLVRILSNRSAWACYSRTFAFILRSHLMGEGYEEA